MKQKLAILTMMVAVALGCWKALAGYNPHITYLDLSIDGVLDILEYFEPDPNTPSPTPITPNPPKGPGGFVELNGWKMITLKANGGNSPMKTRLNWNSTKIEVWTATNGGTQVTSPKLWDPASGMPTELWVKGVAVSASGPTATSCGPEHMTLEAINNGEDPTTPGTYYDRIAFTVVNVTFQAGSGSNLQSITDLTALLDLDAKIEAVVSPAGAGSYISYSIADTAKATVSPSTGTTSPQPLTIHGVSTSSVPTTLSAKVSGEVCGSLPVTVDKERWILSYWGPASGSGSGSGSSSASGLSPLSVASATATTTAGETDVASGVTISIPDNDLYHFRFRAGGNWFLTLIGFSRTVTWSGAAEESSAAGYSIATNSWATPGSYTVIATRTWYCLWFIPVSSTSESITVKVIHIEFDDDKTVAWTAGGTYNAKTNLTAASYNKDNVTWAITTGVI